MAYGVCRCKHPIGNLKEAIGNMYEDSVQLVNQLFPSLPVNLFSNLIRPKLAQPKIANLIEISRSCFYFSFVWWRFWDLCS